MLVYKIDVLETLKEAGYKITRGKRNSGITKK